MCSCLFSADSCCNSHLMFSFQMGKNNFYLCDVLSNLPDSLIDDILMRLPLQNVVSTNILSMKCNIIGIDFHNWNLIKHFGKKHRTWYLLIYFLTRNGIQLLVLKPPFRSKSYELPSSYFTCSQLRYLCLKYCQICPHPVFEKFD